MKAPTVRAADLRSAEEPPVYVLERGDRRLRYVGRLLSVEEWLPWAEEMDRINAIPEGLKRVSALLAFARGYLGAVFPRNRYRFWAPDVVDAILRLPVDQLQEVIADFFLRQARAAGFAPTKTTTPGSNSAPSTTSAADDATPSARASSRRRTSSSRRSSTPTPASTETTDGPPVTG